MPNDGTTYGIVRKLGDELTGATDLLVDDFELPFRN